MFEVIWLKRDLSSSEAWSSPGAGAADGCVAVTDTPKAAGRAVAAACTIGVQSKAGLVF